MKINRFRQTDYAAARRRLSSVGIQLLWTPWDQEYRVTFRRGTKEEREERAYYTNDLDDALRTGMIMALVKLPSEQPVMS